MERARIFALIDEFVTELGAGDDVQVTEAVTFTDLGVDSLSLIDLLFTLERQLGVGMRPVRHAAATPVELRRQRLQLGAVHRDRLLRGHGRVAHGLRRRTEAERVRGCDREESRRDQQEGEQSGDDDGIRAGGHRQALPQPQLVNVKPLNSMNSAPR